MKHARWQRGVVLVAAILSTSLLGYVVYRIASGDRRPVAWTYQDHLPKEVNEAYDRMLNHIRVKAIFDDEDVAYCLEHANSDVWQNRGMAHTLLFEAVRDGKIVQERHLAGVRAAFVEDLNSESASSRRMAIRHLRDAGWLGFPEVRKEIERLRRDPDPLVVELATKVLQP